MLMQLTAPTSARAAQNARAPHHFDFVDSLRGFAILAVLMIHCGQKVPQMFGLRYTEIGGNGVELFFVVSAFTLFWSLSTRTKVDRRPILAFFTRRFFRIAPLFWAGLLFYLWTPDANRLLYAPNGIGWPHILSTAFFVHGWYPTTINSVVPGGWSIGDEMMLYLCLPLLHKFIKSLNSALLLVLASTLGPSAALFLGQHLFTPLMPSHAQLISVFVYWSFPSQLPVFCMGVVLYFIIARQMSTNAQPDPDRRQHRTLFLLVAAFNLLLRDIPPQIIYAGAFVMIAWALAIHPLRLLVNPITRYLGLVSYSFYIWHFTILDHIAPRILPLIHLSPNTRLNQTIQFFALYLIVGTISAAAATISYHLIELPSQRLGKKLIHHLQWDAAPRVPAQHPAAKSEMSHSSHSS